MAITKNDASSSATNTTNPLTDKDGRFQRMPSQFRNFIPSEKFPAERDRYVLYIHPGCPWAHRTNLTRSFKHLEDVIQLVVLDDMDPVKGWCFTGKIATEDPIYGVKYLRELYARADPGYTGRILVPVLWDKKHETIVSNESSEIIRMLYSAFDEFLPQEMRESTKGDAGIFPDHLQSDIEKMNKWVYDLINNGVYRAGFAKSQDAYDEAVHGVFDGLDRLEAHLSQPGHHPYLFGENITEADLRLFPTIVRFDAAYHTLFKCNIKMIRYDYPRIHDWLRKLYWDDTNDVFRRTTYFDFIKTGYSRIALGAQIIPAGPVPNILPL